MDETELAPISRYGAAEISSLLPDLGGGVEAIAELTRQAGRTTLVAVPTSGLGNGLPEKVPVLIDHRPGGPIKAIKDLIEAYRQRPERRTGTARVTTLRSFVDLVTRFADPKTSAIFGAVNWPNPSLTAIIDYHGEGNASDPNHLKHRIVYAFPVTEEMKLWIELNGRGMSQAEFAQFLEDHAAELSAPFPGEKLEFEALFHEGFATPAELLTLSRELEVHVSSKVKQGVRLQSGERTVEFTEEHSNAKSGSPIKIPGIFMVSVRAFDEGEMIRIPARLRYRIRDGALSWSYQLYRPDFWLRNAVRNDLEAAAGQTGAPCFEGAPEA